MRRVATTSSANDNVGFWTMADVVAVPRQDLVHLLPAGAIHKASVDKNNIQMPVCVFHERFPFSAQRERTSNVTGVPTIAERMRG